MVFDFLEDGRRKSEDRRRKTKGGRQKSFLTTYCILASDKVNFPTKLEVKQLF
jgi:hypothetical protein